MILSLGIYQFYWFYTVRTQINTLRRLPDSWRTNALRQLVAAIILIVAYSVFDAYGQRVVAFVLFALASVILYWLYRDISQARETVKLSGFPASVYAFAATPLFLVYAFRIGSTSLQNISDVVGILADLIFFGVVVYKLNQYLDTSSKGAAREAKLGVGEIVIMVLGSMLIGLIVLGTVIVLLASH